MARWGREEGSEDQVVKEGKGAELGHLGNQEDYIKEANPSRWYMTFPWESLVPTERNRKEMGDNLFWFTFK